MVTSQWFTSDLEIICVTVISSKKVALHEKAAFLVLVFSIRMVELQNDIVVADRVVNDPSAVYGLVVHHC